MKLTHSSKKKKKEKRKKFGFLCGFCVLVCGCSCFHWVCLRGEVLEWVLVFMRCNWKKEFSFHVSTVERSKHYLFCYKGFSIEAECSINSNILGERGRKKKKKKKTESKKGYDICSQKR
jgi:hypothetical protein